MMGLDRIPWKMGGWSAFQWGSFSMQTTAQLKVRGCGIFCANVNRKTEIEEDNCCL